MGCSEATYDEGTTSEALDALFRSSVKVLGMLCERNNRNDGIKRTKYKLTGIQPISQALGMEALFEQLLSRNLAGACVHV